MAAPAPAPALAGRSASRRAEAPESPALWRAVERAAPRWAAPARLPPAAGRLRPAPAATLRAAEAPRLPRAVSQTKANRQPRTPADVAAAAALAVAGRRPPSRRSRCWRLSYAAAESRRPTTSSWQRYGGGTSASDHRTLYDYARQPKAEPIARHRARAQPQPCAGPSATPARSTDLTCALAASRAPERRARRRARAPAVR